MADDDPFSIFPYRWPLPNSGNSWSVPRIRMPDFFGFQHDMQQDSWVYDGHGVDTTGRLWHLFFTFGRMSFGSRAASGQPVYAVGSTGPAGSAQADTRYGYGFGIAEDPGLPAPLLIQPATDSRYDVLFTPQFGTAQLRVRYAGGAAVGIAGSRYQLDFDDTPAAGGAAPRMRISLEMIDEFGTMLEGDSGFVAPPGGQAGLYTYEVTQPRLKIECGTIRVGDELVVLTGGMLWHDRQAYTTWPGIPAGAGDNGAPVDAAGPAPAQPARYSLYRGNWIALTFDNGISGVLAPMWPQAKAPQTQWISGTKVGRPPIGGYGNLYFPPDLDFHNGGMRLHALGPDADFDVNIFEPDDPSKSPSWKNSDDVVYCTKWQIGFSRAVTRLGVPDTVYMEMLIPGCPIAFPLQNSFYEGAARLYSDRACAQPIGHAFVEQMGYN